MKHSKPFLLALILCLALNFCACGQEPAQESSAPSTSAPTEPSETVPALTPLELYEAALAAVNSQDTLVVDFGFSETRTVSSETYSENRSGTAYYSGIGTQDPTALITETYTAGSYSAQYITSYLNGSGWSRVSNCSFRCDMSMEEFLSQQLPTVLMDSSLYTNITAETTDSGTVLYFDGASSLESWVTDCEDAAITNIWAKLVLDAQGNPTAGTYHAEYTLMTTVYTLDVEVEITYPTDLDFSDLQPVYPEDCPVVEDLGALRYLLQVVGDVYATENLSVTYYDTMYSQAFGQIRVQSTTYDTYGSGSSFIAGLTSQVSVTDYTGTAVTNSQNVTFIDNQYTYSYNGGEPTTDTTVTAEQVRINWEDSILSALMMPSHIENIKVENTGDFLQITFTGNETLAKSLCSSIYSLFGMDLDAYAESYSTEYVKGYLTVNRYTGLPTAMGLSLSRSHVINKVSYLLTYQLDQALELVSTSAYKNITGEMEPETETATATPLFYKVTGTDGQVMYLLGTIHVGDCRTANLPKALMDAFAASDALAIECDNDKFAQLLESDTALQAQLSNIYYYTNGSTISSHISQDVYDRLEPLMTASGNNNINAPYLRTVIWQSQISNFLLQQSYSLSDDKGMESRLQAWAAQQGKPVYEVESVLAQLKMLTDFSDDLQEMLLAQTLDAGMAGTYEETLQLYELWCQGNEAALTTALTGTTEELPENEAALEAEYQKAMITDRNIGMRDAAIAYLESGETVFYAVGLGHVLGEDGLVQLLRDAGYTVEIVYYQ